MKRRDFAGGMAALYGMAHAASTYPAKPIRCILGYAAGGASDTLVRIVAEGMQAGLGTTIVVDNRPGASGNIGVAALMQSAPDGYTLLHGENSTLFTNEFLFPKLPYNPDRDFTYIGAIGRVPFTLVVHPSFPARTLVEFVAYVKANPGKVNYGTPGAGSPQRIAMEMFQSTYGLKLTHVAYKGGAPALFDVRSGQIEAMMTDLSIGLQPIRDGSVRALAVSAPSRVASIPDIPTFAEAGFTNNAFTLHGLLGPAGMPRDIVERLNTELNKALHTPKAVQQFANTGLQPTPGTPLEFQQMVRAERSRIGPIIKAAGIKTE